MTTDSLARIDRLYTYSADVVIAYERLNHELFRRFSLGLRQFRRALLDRFPSILSPLSVLAVVGTASLR
jgi:hypothetical protein